MRLKHDIRSTQQQLKANARIDTNNGIKKTNSDSKVALHYIVAPLLILPSQPPKDKIEKLKTVKAKVLPCVVFNTSLSVNKRAFSFEVVLFFFPLHSKANFVQ